ncbi:hypothetical protein DYD21_00725 [Rhodohalobacter sp. SW132]|uniref:hypothetical protein n=1 Tax=Rhodohalobacter sp. SW132 TaxID=2293433 RepID=UPI000E26E0F0|nr:hypothetical protein [Rhodohalobacter sp. SW132]REL38504.1 hypothetical protein DYD21_00725 [Rhodohalobacter sp. SW132]
MKITSLTVLLVCFLLTTNVFSQDINHPKNIEWDKAGAVNPFPDSTEFDRIYRVPPPSASNDWLLIQSAIDSAGASSGTNLVLLEEGTYLLANPLILKAGTHDNVYIKGVGPNHLMNSGLSTILKFDFSDPDKFRVPAYGGINAAIAFRGGPDVTIGKVTDFDPSNNRITISGAENNLSPGDIIRVRSNLASGCGAYPCMGQMNRIGKIISHSPLVIELEHDFSLTWEQQEVYGGLNLEVHKIDALQNVGISSLGLETTGYISDPLPDHFVCKDEPSANRSPHGHHILAFRVYNASLQDLYSYRPIAHHIYMIESFHNTISDSFFDGAIYRHGCSGGHGYGVNLWRKNTLNLVENNIFRDLRRSLVFSRGVHKNVFGYNYSREIAAQTGSSIRGDLSSRNMYDSGNLAEGNILDRILNDTYHEQTYTAYKNAYFRNSTYYNYLENEGGIENYFIGNQGEFNGNHDPLSIKADLYAFLGSETSTHENSSSGYSNPDYLLDITSLYHHGIPAFITRKDSWNQNYTWPPIGPRLHVSDPPLTQDIPARGRYCAAYNNYADSAYRCSGIPASSTGETGNSLE